ncbi:MAG: hypothetical protein V4813_14855 [Gemmatimonadota bacterium]
MKYESIEFHGEPAAEAAIVRDDPAELLYVPVAASLYSENLEWAQGVCLRLSVHSHFNVRGNAILGFGHLARRFRQLDRSRVEPFLRSALLDADPYVAGHAYDAIDDVRHFLGWDL